MKKIFTLVLSMLLIFLQTTPAFAENTDDPDKEPTVIQSEETDDETTVIQSNENGNQVSKTSIQTYAGNSMADATSVSFGTTYNGSITSENAYDFYKFTITSSGKVSLSSTAVMDSVNYELYDSTSDIVWHNTYFANNTGQSSINKELYLTKGTYYLEIGRYFSSSAGTYSFKLTFTSTGETFGETGNGNNNTIATANNISMGTTYKGQIALNDSNDFYKFTIASSGRVSLTSTAVIPTVCYRLYDSTGEPLWHNYYSLNSSGQSSINESLYLTKGTYYLGIEQSSGTGTYSFKLAFTSAGESFTETGNGINNTIATASKISTGITYKGQIAENDDRDYYKFTINSSGNVLFTCATEVGTMTYEIYDSEQNRLWYYTHYYSSSDNYNFSEEFTLTKGTYYLCIKNSSHTGNYSFKLLPPCPFKDVSSDKWYYGTVLEANELGLMTGTTSTTFAPSSPTTRGMVATILHRMAGTPSVTYKKIFSDVPDGKYYSKAVTWAANKGVINGSNGKFMPGSNVTRQDMAVMICNYAKFKKINTSSNQSLTKFKDYKNVSSYAEASMKWCVEKGILSGTADGKLNPKANATRAECAKMLLQLYKLK